VSGVDSVAVRRYTKPMNSMISNGAPFGSDQSIPYCWFLWLLLCSKLIDVGQGSMMLTNFGIGWGDRRRCKGIGRFVWTILLMVCTIVVL
jgi:hypothetical protein